jgi:hypothetical protein
MSTVNFREKLSYTDELRREEGTYILTKEFFNVQAQCSRIRGYADVACRSKIAVSRNETIEIADNRTLQT